MAYGNIDSRAEKSCSYMHDATLMFIIYVRKCTLCAVHEKSKYIYYGVARLSSFACTPSRDLHQPWRMMMSLFNLLCQRAESI
jgi:hypothetical protein